MDHEGLLTIGEVSKLAGVGIEAIRFYERKGILKKPRRTPSGYRQYTEEVVRRLEFIQGAKELGFSLAEISELLSLKADPRRSCSSVKKKAEKKISDITEKIKALQRMKRALVRLSKACSDGKASTSNCPILDALDCSKSLRGGGK